MKRKTTKRALLMSAMALVLCVSMLIGTTYAWFTDSVTSAGNVIKAGNLQVAMKWAEGSKAIPAEDSTLWNDAEQGAIFDYALWEPGYVQARHVQIKNIGNLALKYQLRILANGVVSDLANVIDVYYFDGGVVPTRGDFTASAKLGTLAEVLNVAYAANLATTVSGVLDAGDDSVVTLAFKMQESAGNEYMNKSIGSTFSVQLLATQLTAEEDSFGDQYDADADFPSQETPTAMVYEIEESVVKGIELIDTGKNSIVGTLDTGYSFQPTETYEQAMNAENLWDHADFYVYAHRDVPANSLLLAGYYAVIGDFIGIDAGTWIGLTSDATVRAGEGIRLLRDGMNLSVAYSEICNYGNDGIGFLCGASDLTGENAGTTITVELRLYSVDDCAHPDDNCHHDDFDCEDGSYVTVGTFSYTF